MQLFFKNIPFVKLSGDNPYIHNVEVSNTGLISFVDPGLIIDGSNISSGNLYDFIDYTNVDYTNVVEISYNNQTNYSNYSLF